MSYTIYLRTNKVNGMQYVGQTGDFDNRERCWRCLKARYSNKYIKSDREKYGLDAFDVLILADVETQEEAHKIEQIYIKELNTIFPNGYNMAVGGKKNTGIGKSSKEIKGEKHYLYGKHLTSETKKKLSEANKGKHSSPETEFKKIRVKQYTKDNQFIKEWDGARDVEKEIGIYASAITACCKGKRNTAGGFKWQYA